MYTSTMKQCRAPPSGDVWPAKKLGPSQWVLIPDTHEAVISHEQWDRAQHLKTLAQEAAPSVPTQNPSIERNCLQDSLGESYPRRKPLRCSMGYKPQPSLCIVVTKTGCETCTLKITSIQTRLLVVLSILDI